MDSVDRVPLDFTGVRSKTMTMPANQIDETTPPMPTVVRDRKLLQRYTREGSEPAFHELVERHLRLVYATCLRELGDAALAEDAAQIVFLILARKAPNLMLGQSLAGWLFVTARYTCNDLRRRELRRRRHETDLDSVDPSSLRYEDFAWSFIDPNLNDALMSLSTIDRDAVLLRFFEQRSYKEVGEQLSLTEAAAERRVARALVKLRRQLVNAGFAASVSALGALLLERSAHAVAEDLTATVLKIGSGSPHAYAALITAKAASITQQLARSTRVMRLKITSGVAASTAGVFLIYGIATGVHHLPRKITSIRRTVTVASMQPVDIDPAITPTSTQRRLNSRNVRRGKPHSRQAAQNNAPGSLAQDIAAPDDSAPAPPPPSSTVVPAAAPTIATPVVVAPAPIAPATSIASWPSTQDRPPYYIVVPIPDNDPQSQNVAYRESGKDFLDADRPVSINDNGDILYRCGDVYHWDGSTLSFERRTTGLPRRVVLQAPPKARRQPKEEHRVGLVQEGNTQIAVDADDTASISPDRSPRIGDEGADSPREHVVLRWLPSVAASIDDSGNVLGINQSGVFIESPGAPASFVCKPGSIVNIAACDFQARFLDDGRVAADLVAAPGDLSDVGVRDVSFSYSDSQVGDLSAVVAVPAGFHFSDVNDSGLVIGTAGSAQTAVCFSAGQSYKLGGLDNFVHAQLAPRGVNSSGDIVGYVGTGRSGDGVLWKHGKAYDLNDLLHHSRQWRISRAFAIDSRGEILAYGRLDGRETPLLLVPANIYNDSVEASN